MLALTNNLHKAAKGSRLIAGILTRQNQTPASSCNEKKEKSNATIYQNSKLIKGLL